MMIEIFEEIGWQKAMHVIIDVFLLFNILIKFT